MPRLLLEVRVLYGSATQQQEQLTQHAAGEFLI